MPVNDNQSDNNAFAVMIENKHHEWTVFICHLITPWLLVMGLIGLLIGSFIGKLTLH